MVHLHNFHTLLGLCGNIRIHQRACMSKIAEVEFMLNGKCVKVPSHYTILRAAKKENIVVPSFCYHERLAVAGNCRMCMVDVEGWPKPQLACATPISKGMKVKTDSKRALVAQEAALEFLLVNHPLDCPVCDQGGECDLQDLSMRFGGDRSRFTDIYFDGKRAVEDKNLGPLIRTEMTRCIHCTRCIRFASEVCGLDVLGTTGRGTDMQVGTYVDKVFLSELSGNIVDLCPVGALTAAPYTFKARPWETRTAPSIDVTDATGTNIVISFRGERVMRMLPRENDEINQEWLSDKGRWSMDSLELQRLVAPMNKTTETGNRLMPTEWGEALKLASELVCETPPGAIYAIAGPHCTTEALVAAKDYLNVLGSENTYVERDFDFTPCGVDFRVGYLMTARMKDVLDADKILLVGTNPRFEAPILNAWIRRAYIENDADIFYVGSECDFNYYATHLGETMEKVKELACTHDVVQHRDGFYTGKKPLIFVGASQLSSKFNGPALMQYVYQIAGRFASHVPKDWGIVNILPREASWAGALECGWKPGALQAMQINPPRILLMLGADQVLYETGSLPRDCNVIYIGFQGDRGAEVAQVVLAGCAFTETEGIYLNMEGRAQLAMAATTPPGRARHDWKIIRALAEFCDVHLPYADLEGIRYRMSQISPNLGAFGVFQPKIFQEIVETSLIPENDSDYQLTIDMRRLADYYCSDVYTRNSPLMARSTRATIEAAKSPYAGV